MMKKVISTLLVLLISLCAFAKQWPTNALYQLQSNPGIKLDCQYLGAMLGRDMSNTYPQRLLQLYKESYYDYSDFERYTYKYRYSCDPIRLNLIKSFTKNCSFESIWNILEKGSPEVSKLRQTNYNDYCRLRSITVQNLKSYFKTMDNFTDSICLNPSSFDNTIRRIVKQSIDQL